MWGREECEPVGDWFVAMKREDGDEGFHGGESKDLGAVLGCHWGLEAFCHDELEFSGGLVNGCNEW